MEDLIDLTEEEQPTRTSSNPRPIGVEYAVDVLDMYDEVEVDCSCTTNPSISLLLYPFRSEDHAGNDQRNDFATNGTRSNICQQTGALAAATGSGGVIDLDSDNDEVLQQIHEFQHGSVDRHSKVERNSETTKQAAVLGMVALSNGEQGISQMGAQRGKRKSDGEAEKRKKKKEKKRKRREKRALSLAQSGEHVEKKTRSKKRKSSKTSDKPNRVGCSAHEAIELASDSDGSQSEVTEKRRVDTIADRTEGKGSTKQFSKVASLNKGFSKDNKSARDSSAFATKAKIARIPTQSGIAPVSIVDQHIREDARTQSFSRNKSVDSREAKGNLATKSKIDRQKHSGKNGRKVAAPHLLSQTASECKILDRTESVFKPKPIGIEYSVDVLDMFKDDQDVDIPSDCNLLCPASLFPFKAEPIDGLTTTIGNQVPISGEANEKELSSKVLLTNAERAVGNLDGERLSTAQNSVGLKYRSKDNIRVGSNRRALSVGTDSGYLPKITPVSEATAEEVVLSDSELADRGDDLLPPSSCEKIESDKSIGSISSATSCEPIEVISDDEAGYLERDWSLPTKNIGGRSGEGVVPASASSTEHGKVPATSTYKGSSASTANTSQGGKSVGENNQGSLPCRPKPIGVEHSIDVLDMFEDTYDASLCDSRKLLIPLEDRASRDSIGLTMTAATSAATKSASSGLTLLSEPASLLNAGSEVASDDDSSKRFMVAKGGELPETNRVAPRNSPSKATAERIDGSSKGRSQSPSLNDAVTEASVNPAVARVKSTPEVSAQEVIEVTSDAESSLSSSDNVAAKGDTANASLKGRVRETMPWKPEVIDVESDGDSDDAPLSTMKRKVKPFVPLPSFLQPNFILIDMTNEDETTVRQHFPNISRAAAYRNSPMYQWVQPPSKAGFYRYGQQQFFVRGKDFTFAKTRQEALEEQESLFSQAAANMHQHQAFLDSINRQRIASPGCPTFTQAVDVSKLNKDHWKWECPFARLGLPTDAGGTAIKKQYRKHALRYHPDKCRLKDASLRFQAVTEAYNKIRGDS
jgi:hypothetical protein